MGALLFFGGHGHTHGGASHGHSHGAPKKAKKEEPAHEHSHDGGEEEEGRHGHAVSRNIHKQSIISNTKVL